MKEGWVVKPLGEVCQIRPPKAEARQRLAPTDEVSFVPMESLGIGEKTFVSKQTKPLAAVSGSYTYFAENDLLLAKITPCFENGKLGIARNLTNGVGFGSSEYIVFRPSLNIHVDWLYHYLNREAFRTEGASKMSGAVGHKRVPLAFIETYPIPVPPIEEQNRIVAKLDEAFEAIASAKEKAEQNLLNAQLLFDCYLDDIFDTGYKKWQGSSLGDLAKINYGYTESAQFEAVGPHFLRITDIQNGCVDWSQVPFCKIESTNIPRFQLKSGDIVFARTGATTGKSFLVANPPRAVFASYLIRLRLCDANLMPEFVSLFFQTTTYWKAIQNGSTGSAQGGFNASKLAALPIPIPPHEEQREIVSKLSDLSEKKNNLASIYQQKIKVLDELKQSLLHQAFSGEL